MESGLGLKSVVSENFDTDRLGTFTGEIERKDEVLQTLRNKCLQAMEMYNSNLCIASEGSFGPHPQMWYVPADDEWLLFMDKENDLEITARELTTETNLGGREVRTEQELADFAERALFPSHGLILRRDKLDVSTIVKGITDHDKLYAIFQMMLSTYGSAYVETDMRAMYNPTRMKVIQRATEKLVEKIKSQCPQCRTPGYDISNAISGLPCSNCGSPTKSILSYVYGCKKCAFKEVKRFPHGRLSEDPMFCDFCNP